MRPLHLLRNIAIVLAGVAAFGVASAQNAGDGATLPGSNSGSVQPTSPMARPAGEPGAAPRDASPGSSPEEQRPYDDLGRAADPTLRQAPRRVDPGNMTEPTDPEAGAIQIEGQTAPANPTR
ncbi:hypothetical protein M8A51_05875 [Schlegelella sp. S2-27]|uniref:Serine/threonine protein kinase n=1 Tax=Caldimonas mangrovi TaxID=2944811 RepID=A0ABT0YJZ9_9BURK|nr:hypothetical protein [Caldimonas mangrovi]MCM5679058.1 hypothetical protein [Caldimonas mangrovi]